MIIYKKSKIQVELMDYQDIRWVLRARGKRHNLDYILSTGKRIVATDGHRLHTAKLSVNPLKGIYEIMELKDGRIIFNPIPSDIKYPNWCAVIPRHKRAINLKLVNSPDVDNIISLSLLIRTIPPSKTINIKYFNDALSGDYEWDVSQDADSDQPFLFRNKRKLAIVMPMRI